jgi:hypothetical protein
MTRLHKERIVRIVPKAIVASLPKPVAHIVDEPKKNEKALPPETVAELAELFTEMERTWTQF